MLPKLAFEPELHQAGGSKSLLSNSRRGGYSQHERTETSSTVKILSKKKCFSGGGGEEQHASTSHSSETTEHHALRQRDRYLYFYCISTPRHRVFDVFCGCFPKYPKPELRLSWHWKPPRREEYSGRKARSGDTKPLAGR